jgi:hypothetical protein
MFLSGSRWHGPKAMAPRCGIRRRHSSLMISLAVAPSRCGLAGWMSGMYPPKVVQRRTVPCCLPCNQRLHAAEDAVALDLLFVCNPERPEIAGVQQNISRSWKPDQARGGEDPKHRSGKQLKILRTMEWFDPPPGAPRAYVQKAGGLYRPVVKVSATHFESLTFALPMAKVKMTLTPAERRSGRWCAGPSRARQTGQRRP